MSYERNLTYLNNKRLIYRRHPVSDKPDIDTKEFMYFDDEQDLDKKINHIVNNYNEFDDMRINAYNRAINNYTTKHFVDRYLK